ncbi:hypothetical protein E2C01_044775 [Portunus trituberculatus]|uniref:Uncharacterized protein n=1 Tax=Portunus trituberculatus TaxID=210409 RepID=A0A5B7FTZ3_PORTR|nr:hypothetical protein [Portunus trituberculatus]
MRKCPSRKKRRQVDKATSTTDLHQKEAVPPDPSQHYLREDTPEEVDLIQSESSFSATGGTEIEQTTPFLKAIPCLHRCRTPTQDQPHPKDHDPHRDPSPARDTPFDREEPPGRDTPPTIYSRTARRAGESPDSKSPSAKESPDCNHSSERKKWRSKSTSGRSSAYRKRLPGWQRSYDWRSPAWKGPHHRERSRRRSSSDRRRSIDSHESQATSDAAGHSCESHIGTEKAEAIKCFLVVVLAVLAVMYTYPPSISPVSWSVLSQQTLLVTVLNVALLVIAVCSILTTVKTTTATTTELAVAAILCLLNGFLVHQVKFFFPHLSLWLSAVILPLAMLTAGMLCTEMALTSPHTR